MPSHLESKHPGIEIPSSFEEAYTISNDERIHLHLVKGALTNPPKKQGTKRKAESAGQSSKKARK
jgi:hypothetical protein